MSVENFVDLSVVQLNDGRSGTVVHIYSDSRFACVEIGIDDSDDSHELIDVSRDEVERILWLPNVAAQ